MLIPLIPRVPGGSLKHMLSTFHLNPLVTITLNERLISSVVPKPKAATLRHRSKRRETDTHGNGKEDEGNSPTAPSTS